MKASCSQEKKEWVIVTRAQHSNGLAVVVFAGKFKEKGESESKLLTKLRDKLAHSISCLIVLFKYQYVIKYFIFTSQAYSTY